VAIPGSLLISSIGLLDDVRCACTADLKSAGDAVYLLGVTRPELGGSLYAALGHARGYAAPALAEQGPQTARALHQAIISGWVRACHDCSEGGLGVALAEMALAGDLGVSVDLSALPVEVDSPRGLVPGDDWLLFGESNGRYLVEVREDHCAAFEACLGDIPWARVGHVTDRRELVIRSVMPGGPEVVVSLAAVEAAWRGHVEPRGRTGASL